MRTIYQKLRFFSTLKEDCIDFNGIVLEMTHIAIEIKQIIYLIYGAISNGLIFFEQNESKEVSDRFFSVAHNRNVFVVSVTNVVFIHILFPSVYHFIGFIDEYTAIRLDLNITKCANVLHLSHIHTFLVYESDSIPSAESHRWLEIRLEFNVR